MKSPLQTLSLGLLLTAAASAQGGAVDLARVRATFQKADASQDGKLDSKEAIKAGIPAADVRRLDHDKDGTLSSDEFLLYYRQLLSRAGRKAAKDLEDEAARILAARKQATDRARRDAARQGQGEGSGPAPQAGPTEKPAQRPTQQPQGGNGSEPAMSSDLARAADLVRRAVRTGRVQASEGAEVLDLLQAKGPQDATSLREQHRRARARIQAMANSGAVSADQGRQLMNAIGRRLQQAGVQPAPEVASPAGSAPADQTPASQAPATQAPGAQAQGELQRAAALVRVAVRSGRVQASEGAEVLELLEAKGAQDADSLRTQHRKARARIQAMANAGVVTPEQGRQLMNAIGRRLQQAGVQPAPEVKDAKPGQQPQAKPAQQNELQRAAAVVRLAVRSGRVQASQGAEVLDLLEAKGAQDAESLRTQHRKARARIQAMLQDGSVTPDQGRQLMNAIGRRLQQAGVKPAEPAPAERGEGARPAPGPQPAPQQRRGATRRGTKTPNAQDPSKPAADVTGRPAARPQEAPKPARRPATRKPADPPRAKPQPKPQPRPQPRTGGGRDGR